MTEAYIVATARSPIGRARKGSLAGIRPDDLAARMVQAALDKVPGLDPARIDDLMIGMRSARRRAGHEPRAHRRGAARPRRRARHDGEPLLLVVAADHADGLPRDQGGRGRRLRLGGGRVGVSGYGAGLLGSCRRAFNPAVRDAARRTHGARSPVARPRGPTRARRASCPTRTSRWGRRPRTSRRCAASPARSRMPSPRGRSSAPRRRSRRGSGRATSRRSTLDDGTVVVGRRRPAPRRDARGARRPRPGLPPRRHGHGGQLLPAQRRRGGGRRRVGPGRGRARASNPLARIVSTGVSALSPEIMGLGPVEASRRALIARGADRSTTSTSSRSTRRSRRR